MTIIFDFDGVSSELVRIHKEYRTQFPENEGIKFVDSFYGDHGDVARLVEANEWLRSTYAPDLTPEEFSTGSMIVITSSGEREHSHFIIALGALLKDIKEDLSSKGIV